MTARVAQLSQRSGAGQVYRDLPVVRHAGQTRYHPAAGVDGLPRPQFGRSGPRLKRSGATLARIRARRQPGRS